MSFEMNSDFLYYPQQTQKIYKNKKLVGEIDAKNQTNNLMADGTNMINNSKLFDSLDQTTLMTSFLKQNIQQTLSPKPPSPTPSVSQSPIDEFTNIENIGNDLFNSINIGEHYFDNSYPLTPQTLNSKDNNSSSNVGSSSGNNNIHQKLSIDSINEKQVKKVKSKPIEIINDNSKFNMINVNQTTADNSSVLSKDANRPNATSNSTENNQKIILKDNQITTPSGNFDNNYNLIMNNTIPENNDQMKAHLQKKNITETNNETNTENQAIMNGNNNFHSNSNITTMNSVFPKQNIVQNNVPLHINTGRSLNNFGLNIRGMENPMVLPQQNAASSVLLTPSSPTMPTSSVYNTPMIYEVYSDPNVIPQYYEENNEQILSQPQAFETFQVLTPSNQNAQGSISSIQYPQMINPSNPAGTQRFHNIMNQPRYQSIPNCGMVGSIIQGQNDNNIVMPRIISHIPNQQQLQTPHINGTNQAQSSPNPQTLNRFVFQTNPNPMPVQMPMSVPVPVTLPQNAQPAPNQQQTAPNTAAQYGTPNPTTSIPPRIKTFLPPQPQLKFFNSYPAGNTPYTPISPFPGSQPNKAMLLPPHAYPRTLNKRKHKRKRTTTGQLDILLNIFKTNDTPPFEVREELAKKVNMTNREVQVWFQNRRAKVNRERSQGKNNNNNNNNSNNNRYNNEQVNNNIANSSEKDTTNNEVKINEVDNIKNTLLTPISPGTTDNFIACEKK
ncbi:hypothetical protein BCR36DRAFT_582384 [Piromyces finnis]|uniref:Homeobox domain-containing protein n=2 Tax=Neocallimastigaceae TaxID=29007 RepID=A0A1Y1VEP5_9FUNG|nr:hypothetical protein BCR36DRAFT_582384 [Piromyces finnis]|eukprot:ORX52982.1 hypothetical protein BCR36DRAFT_582384 [Piromyces finnis]